MVNQKIFRAYDIRGTYPGEINEMVGFKIGAALTRFLKGKLKKKSLKIIIGRDCRLSSDSLFKAFCRGVFSQQGTVVDIGLVSTDTLYFAISYLKYDGGAMITASHNPKDDNGFKMLAQGQKFIYQDWGMKEIKKMVNEIKFEKKIFKGKIIKKNIVPPYVKYVLNLIDLRGIKPLKAVVDAGNGMAGVNISRIAKEIPVILYPMYFEPNGAFPFRNPDPTIKGNIKDCQKMVVKKKADFGLAFDADADREVFIDEQGKVLGGDIIIALFSRYFLRKYPGRKIAYNLTCSQVVEETIKESGGYPIKTKTGRPFIREEALKNKVIFAGEKSGHLFFSDVFYSECGGLAFLTMLKILSETRESLSELVKPFRKYHQLEANLKINDQSAAIKKISGFYHQEKKNRLDGLTIKAKDWRFNVRSSNTEPYLRLVVESKNKKTAQEKFKQVKKIIKKFSLNV